MRNQNERGEYALYDKGQIIGYAAITYVDGKKVVATYKKTIDLMKAQAAKDGVLLTLNSGFRSFDEQLALRKQNVKDKTQVKNEAYLLTAKSTEFSPSTAIPGWSNHQEGTAYDFQTRDNAATKQNEALAFAWLFKNAITYGMIRTVPSERWHWEFVPGKDKFSVVPKTHESWDGLAS